MHKYDYSFLKDIKITSKLIGLSNVIVEINQKSLIQRQKNPKQYFKLHEKATVESAVSSNRIEGVQTSKVREKQLLVENQKPLDHNEYEISGYRDALEFIMNNYEEIDINEDTIKGLHKMMMDYSDRQASLYKSRDNEVVLTRQDGSREVLFNPVSSKEVKDNIKQLIDAYKHAQTDSEINNMLLIPCFIVDFLSIHPFDDGNGRVSRLLTLLLLYKEGFDIGKYISYEKMIEDYKWNYYSELNKSQNGWHENSNDYSFFIVFHFQILYRCYSQLSSLLTSDINGKQKTKKSRIETYINDSIIPVSKTDIADALVDISVTTIEKVLSDLIKENKIEKIGTYKNARYIKANNIS